MKKSELTPYFVRCNEARTALFAAFISPNPMMPPKMIKQLVVEYIEMEERQNAASSAFRSVAKEDIAEALFEEVRKDQKMDRERLDSLKKNLEGFDTLYEQYMTCLSGIKISLNHTVNAFDLASGYKQFSEELTRIYDNNEYNKYNVVVGFECWHIWYNKWEKQFLETYVDSVEQLVKDRMPREIKIVKDYTDALKKLSGLLRQEGEAAIAYTRIKPNETLAQRINRGPDRITMELHATMQLFSRAANSFLSYFTRASTVSSPQLQRSREESEAAPSTLANDLAAPLLVHPSLKQGPSSGASDPNEWHLMFDEYNATLEKGISPEKGLYLKKNQ